MRVILIDDISKNSSAMSSDAKYISKPMFAVIDTKPQVVVIPLRTKENVI